MQALLSSYLHVASLHLASTSILLSCSVRIIPMPSDLVSGVERQAPDNASGGGDNGFTRDQATRIGRNSKQ